MDRGWGVRTRSLGGLAVCVAVAAGTPLSAQVPQVVADFMAGAPPRTHPAAPAETEQFARLSGVWEVTEQTFDPSTGARTGTAEATWAWRRIADGFGVEDFWYQPADRYPWSGQLGRGLELRQIRVFDPRAGHWKVAMINSTGGHTPAAVFRTFTAREVEGEIVMTYDQPRPDRDQRLVFFDIGPHRFSWRAEMSVDGGETWVLLSRIDATRVE